jgi:uncharacterized protein GlcG (DUF336 family)
MYERPVLDIDECLAALDAMLDAAVEGSGQPLALAIVDDQGDTICFARMDGVGVRNRGYALDKAYTAARMRMDLGDFSERRGDRPVSDYGDTRFVGAKQGGIVIRDPSTGWVMGAIGVSGGATGQDDSVGQVGLDALGLHN